MRIIYRTVLFKILEPVIVLDKGALREYIDNMELSDTKFIHVEAGVRDMLNRVLGLMELADWMFSNTPPEDLGK